MLKGAFKRRLPRVAAPTFSILGIFWMLSTIVGASGLGRKQSDQAQFSILVFYFIRTILIKREKERGEYHSSERNCVSL